MNDQMGTRNIGLTSEQINAEVELTANRLIAERARRHLERPLVIRTEAEYGPGDRVFLALVKGPHLGPHCEICGGHLGESLITCPRHHTAARLESGDVYILAGPFEIWAVNAALEIRASGTRRTITYRCKTGETSPEDLVSSDQHFLQSVVDCRNQEARMAYPHALKRVRDTYRELQKHVRDKLDSEQQKGSET